MYLAENIRFLRKEKEYSQDYVAEKLGYKSYTTIQKWESGVSEPTVKKLKELANLFNVDMDDLINKQLSRPAQVSDSPTSIRVLGSVAAGVPIEMVEDVIGFEEIPEALARKGEFFALKIKGDSMEPRIYDGDIVVVRKTPDAESGSIVIVSINGDDATCKRLVKYRDSIQLVSLNPKYLPKEFSADEIEALPVKVLGECVEVRGSLKY